MQFYALDGDFPILASCAQKQKDYCCPECRSIVRARSGPCRQIHFYHIKNTRLCSQHKKSLTHLHIQWLLQTLLSPEAAFLEYPFPQIKRIADVFWESKGIVFEVQCSPISKKEAKERCRDYRSLGLIPVWILLDHRYNRTYCSHAELFLRQEPCYFANREGFFYDQLEVYRGARRIFRGPKLKVNFTKPCFTPSFHFDGDLISRYGTRSPNHLEQKKISIKEPFSIVRFVKRIYKSFFHMLLENIK
jgi:competence CoiA-like predicted nuclease